MRVLCIVISAAAVLGSVQIGAADDDVRAAFEKIVKLAGTCDTSGKTLEAIKALTTSDWLMVGSGGVADRTTAYTQPKNCDKAPGPARISDLRVRMYGADTAVLVGRVDFPEGEGQYLTSTWVRQNGKWLEASLHVSAIDAKK